MTTKTYLAVNEIDGGLELFETEEELKDFLKQEIRYDGTLYWRVFLILREVEYQVKTTHSLVRCD